MNEIKLVTLACLSAPTGGKTRQRYIIIVDYRPKWEDKLENGHGLSFAQKVSIRVSNLFFADEKWFCQSVILYFLVADNRLFPANGRDGRKNANGFLYLPIP